MKKEDLIIALADNDFEKLESLLRQDILTGYNKRVGHFSRTSLRIIDDVDPDKAAQLLSDNKALELNTKKGITILMSAALAGAERLVKSLVIAGADVNAHASSGLTPFFAAAWGGNVKLAEFLMPKSADIHEKNRVGRTPIFNPIVDNNVEMVEFLIANRADLNIIDNKGETPLSVAGYYKHKEMVKLLLDNGADPKVINRKDKTVYEMIKDEGIRELLNAYFEQKTLEKTIVESQENPHGIAF